MDPHRAFWPSTADLHLSLVLALAVALTSPHLTSPHLTSPHLTLTLLQSRPAGIQSSPRSDLLARYTLAHSSNFALARADNLLVSNPIQYNPTPIPNNALISIHLEIRFLRRYQHQLAIQELYQSPRISSTTPNRTHNTSSQRF